MAGKKGTLEVINYVLRGCVTGLRKYINFLSSCLCVVGVGVSVGLVPSVQDSANGAQTANTDIVRTRMLGRS
jgi:hypothetical protein